MSPPATASSPAPESEVKLSLWDHLRELRKRLLLSIYGLLVGMAAIGAFVGEIVDKLLSPVLLALNPTPAPDQGKALLQLAAQAPVLPETLRAALQECATAPAVSAGAKQLVGEVLKAQGQLLGQPLVAAMSACANQTAFVDPANKLVYTSAIEPMMVYIKVAMYGGVFVAAPWILFQLWQFVAPGLYKKEKKVVVPFLFWATLLFYAGAAFCWYFVMPAAFPAMLQIASSAVMTPMLSITEQLSLVMALLLGFGVVFEVPVIIAFLSMVGLVSVEFLTKYRRHAVIVNVLLAAIITPTGDPLNLALMAVPMIVFYEVGIILARFLGKKRPAAAIAKAAS